jgi:hypothetical protein
MHEGTGRRIEDEEEDEKDEEGQKVGSRWSSAQRFFSRPH